MLGTTVGKYRITGTLGRGATGIVFKAIDESLGREVALKILNSANADPESCRRFQSEAAVLASLNHPGIATIYDLFTSSTELVMVMELVRGETLEQLCDRVGPLSLDRAVYVIDQVLAALEHAHRAGVVHRDLKPANVMLTETGIKIMDFGVARARHAARLAERHIVGTPAYMAPEQALGETVGESADVYSAGVMFYRVLTGALPFAADSPVAMLQKQVTDPPAPMWQHRGNLPSWCDTIVSRAMAKAPAERFQNAAAFRVALGGAAGHSVRRNTALAMLSQAPSRDLAAARTFRRGSVPPGRRRARVNASLAGFAACVAALSCVPLLSANPKKTPPAVTAPAPVIFDTNFVVRGGRERPGQLTLADCNLEIISTSDTTRPLHLVPYRSIVSTTYTIGRQPLWSSANGPSPLAPALRPRDRRSVRHWLVVRTSTESRFVVLRFEERHIVSLLAALADRTGRATKIFGRSTSR